MTLLHYPLLPSSVLLRPTSTLSSYLVHFSFFFFFFNDTATTEIYTLSLHDALPISAGARIVLGGHRVDRPGFYLEPTIITDIDAKNPLFSQETFGPVASVYVVDDEDEAVALANATPFGLSSAVFSGDVNRARRIADRIESGMVFINQPTVSLPELPFGGIKNSGYGRELSELGFGEFTNRKLINVFPAGSPAT